MDSAKWNSWVEAISLFKSLIQEDFKIHNSYSCVFSSDARILAPLLLPECLPHLHTWTTDYVFTNWPGIYTYLLEIDVIFFLGGRTFIAKIYNGIIPSYPSTNSSSKECLLIINWVVINLLDENSPTPRTSPWASTLKTQPVEMDQDPPKKRASLVVGSYQCHI